MDIDEFEFVAFAYVIRKTDENVSQHESLIVLAGNDCDVTCKHGKTTIANNGTIIIENHDTDDIFDTLPMQLRDSSQFHSHGIQSITVASILQRQTNFRIKQNAIMHLYVKRNAKVE